MRLLAVLGVSVLSLLVCLRYVVEFCVVMLRVLWVVMFVGFLRWWFSSSVF